MAVRTDFTAGEVLAAADLNDTFVAKVDYSLPVNAQTGSGASAYTFVLADALRLTTASNASAGTYTIPPQSSVVWLANTVIRIVNYGAGTVTIAGGAGVTVTNAATTLGQFESAALIRTAENAWTLVPFSGAGNANFSDAATGTYTDGGGINYKYITFTGSGTLTVTKAGLADILVVGGGGPGNKNNNTSAFHSGGGGAGAYLSLNNVFLPEGSVTVTVGAGGAINATSQNHGNGGTSRIADYLAFGGGRGDAVTSGGSYCGASNGGSGGGGGNPAGNGITGLGSAGGTSSSATLNGGGGGGASAVGGNGITTAGGAGGAGTASSITGSSVTRAGGGGGSGSATGGAGGAGGGGAGGAGSGNATNGTDNTGGGGGGAQNGTNGTGGSGVVIVAVKV
jgi:hypothetical protein